MNQGKIIEYIDQGSFICALCLRDKGNRLHLLTLSNREVNLTSKRALLISGTSVNTLIPREELLNRVKQAEELRNRLKEKIQVKELWELVSDEKERFDFKYLAQLCFGKMVTGDHIAALVRALFEDKLYFKMKKDSFFPNSEGRVDQILRQREEEALWEENIRQGSALLKGTLKNNIIQELPCRDDIVNLLIELALYGNEAPNLKHGKELLLRAGISDIGEARNLLIKLGVWDEDENLDLLRLDIRTSFNEKEIQESNQLSMVEIKGTEQEDLRRLPSFTIDGPLTRDFDDALSIEINGDTIQIGVHIADVAGVIAPESILDREAFKRGSALYLPQRQIPMIPLNLSHDTLSLKEGVDRPAISLISRFDMGGNLLDYRFVPSLIRVQRQLTYDQVNELYMQEGMLEQMYRLSRLMRQQRIDQGALILSTPETFIKIDSDSSISLEMIDQETPSRMIVAEFMIFYNWMAARLCSDNYIPILYRGQEEPSERLSIDKTGYLYFVFKQLRKIHPLIIDMDPRPHTGLGLDVYTNVSSPIRRYLDLVVQRQIRNFLLDKPPAYDMEELEKIRVFIYPKLRDIGMMKRNRTRYWIQKYLLQHIGENISALILDTIRNGYRVLLKDFLLVVEMKRENGQAFSNGDSIMVRVKKSDPRNDLLTIEYAGSQEVV
ncbi:MAG: RNB domain-containing ribonuclease [Deltaproteobacteria bacterium]|nr:RNB domain-containing ribonuclease [Deltaproteobacteria bacterium]